MVAAAGLGGPQAPPYAPRPMLVPGPGGYDLAEELRGLEIDRDVVAMYDGLQEQHGALALARVSACPLAGAPGAIATD